MSEVSVGGVGVGVVVEGEGGGEGTAAAHRDAGGDDAVAAHVDFLTVSYVFVLVRRTFRACL